MKSLQLSWRNIPLIAGLLTSMPILIDLAVSERTRKFHFLAPDAFYYFTVARHISRLGVISFDQERPTNGFHPLWQILMAGCHWVMDRTSPQEEGFMTLSLVIGAIYAGLGIYCVGRAAQSERQWVSVWFVFVPVGVLSLMFMPYMSRWTSIWSAVNGMETSAVLFSYGLMAWLYVEQSRSLRDSVMMAAALVLLTLSRLDHGIFAALVVASLWLEAPRSKSTRYVFIVTTLWLVCLCGYLLVNRWYSGMWLPVSGSVKSTFPKITSQNLNLIDQVFDGTVPKASLSGRAIVMLVPPVFAVASLLGTWLVPRTRRSSRYQRFLCLSATGVIVLGIYNLLYVPTFNIGRWYFPVSTLFVSLVVIELATRIRLRRLSTKKIRYVTLGFTSAVIVFIYLTERRSNSGDKNARFYYEEAPRILAHYDSRVPPFVEYDDGIIAYSLGAKALSGWGLVLDREAAEYLKVHKRTKTGSGLMDLALKRGYNRAATVTYAEAKLTPKSNDQQIRDAYKHLLGSSARERRFRVEYLSQDGRFSIVVADPR
jgi:hypothetical protein